MASPQLKNGYTRIENEIMEALARHRIPGEQRQILDVIIRKTDGFNKQEDAISNSQFVDCTGLKKGNASRAIKVLVAKKIVIKNDNRRIPTYQFNKNYKKWKVLSKKQPVIKKATVVIKSDNRLLSKVMDTKESITKETYTKENIYSRVVNYLNLKIKKSYKSTTKTTKAFIDARLNEGFTEENFYTVIDNKSAKWLTNPKMMEFLRPQTLFGTKFESYLQDIPQKIGEVVPAGPQPKTYAQSQDAERRGRARWLKEQLDASNKDTDNQGANNSGHMPKRITAI